MSDLINADDVFGEPTTITVGGKELKLSPLRVSDLAALSRRMKQYEIDMYNENADKVFTPSDIVLEKIVSAIASKTILDSRLSVEIKMALKELVYEMKMQFKTEILSKPVSTAETTAMLSSIEGAQFAIYRSLLHNHPEVTLEDVDLIISQIGVIGLEPILGSIIMSQQEKKAQGAEGEGKE